MTVALIVTYDEADAYEPSRTWGSGPYETPEQAAQDGDSYNEEYLPDKPYSFHVVPFTTVGRTYQLGLAIERLCPEMDQATFEKFLEAIQHSSIPEALAEVAFACGAGEAA